MEIRIADPRRDAAAVAAIYRPIVEETHSSFEDTPPGPTEMERSMAATLERTPWLVAESDREAVGYAYAAAHRERPAYRWSVDISVYVAPTERRHGVGGLLYGELLSILRRQGFVNAYAGVALPNPASEALHRSVGMELVGVYHQVGYKFGNWWDVAWFGLRLSQPPREPADPIPLPHLPA
ncbi:MAG TPA: GNAT family N-acetyltransferase [Acidimicrobiia bacterium]|nr:GNAT family N-acetyltransferase [Acidimicrobiia bacterium]